MGEKKLNVKLIACTEGLNKLPALAAKLCYSASSIDDLIKKIEANEQDKFLEKIKRNGHLSVSEHGNFTYGIDGISRVTSHQLVRHRIASYSQQSQRYVKLTSNGDNDGFGFIIPLSIKALGEEAVEEFNRQMLAIQGFYDHWTEQVPAEDARYVLSNATETKIIVTMNIRELLHFFTVRCCERAQWEIRQMADEMLKLAKEKAFVFFTDAGPACLRGHCSEGEMTCKKINEVREKYGKK